MHGPPPWPACASPRFLRTARRPWAAWPSAGAWRAGRLHPRSWPQGWEMPAYTWVFVFWYVCAHARVFGCMLVHACAPMCAACVCIATLVCVCVCLPAPLFVRPTLRVPVDARPPSYACPRTCKALLLHLTLTHAHAHMAHAPLCQRGALALVLCAWGQAAGAYQRWVSQPACARRASLPPHPCQWACMSVRAGKQARVPITRVPLLATLHLRRPRHAAREVAKADGT